MYSTWLTMAGDETAEATSELVQIALHNSHVNCRKHAAAQLADRDDCIPAVLHALQTALRVPALSPQRAQALLQLSLLQLSPAASTSPHFQRLVTAQANLLAALTTASSRSSRCVCG